MSDHLPGRELWVDAVRGVAICVMVPANMAPMLAEPHRGSCGSSGVWAAPIFVILAGMMVALHRIASFARPLRSPWRADRAVRRVRRTLWRMDSFRSRPAMFSI